MCVSQHMPFLIMDTMLSVFQQIEADSHGYMLNSMFYRGYGKRLSPLGEVSPAEVSTFHPCAYIREVSVRNPLDSVGCVVVRAQNTRLYTLEINQISL